MAHYANRVNKISLFFLTLILISFSNARILYKENFERSGFDTKKYSNVEIVNGGVGGGRCLQVRHIPSSRGSDRVSYKKRFSSVREATLRYYVRFDHKFEFVKGGKLPGLIGGPNRATGCVKQPKDSWSVRLMWRREGIASLYMYHQGRVQSKSRCGIDYKSNFKFRKGKWHRIELFVKVNSSRNRSDGYTSLKIDGKTRLKIRNLKFRATNSKRALIDQFYLSNFYGGSTRSWAPRRTTKMQFDEIRVET